MGGRRGVDRHPGRRTRATREEVECGLEPEPRAADRRVFSSKNLRIFPLRMNRYFKALGALSVVFECRIPTPSRIGKVKALERRFASGEVSCGGHAYTDGSRKVFCQCNISIIQAGSETRGRWH